MIEFFLREKPIVVKSAHTLKDGLTLIDEFEPNIVVLDNNLPDGTGLSKIQLIKKNYPKTKLLVCTAFSVIKDQALKAGADGFIVKPFKISTLLSYF